MKRSRITRTLGILLVSLLLALALAACGGGDSDDGSGTEGTQGEDAAAAGAEGQTIELVVQNHDPAGSICGQYIEAWGSLVEKACEGLPSGNKVKFVYYHGGSLGGAPDSLDMVRNGTADLAWSAIGIYSGQFPVSEGLMLPLLEAKNARDGSAAAMAMLKASPEMQKEFEDFYLIQISACSYHAMELTKKNVQTIADCKGLRIRTPGATVNPFLEGIGAVPTQIPTPETYESLQKNVVDGCVNDWHNVAANKLNELTKYIVDYPFFISPIFMVMNKDKYGSLPDDVRAVFDEYSGDYASVMAGKFWDTTRSWVIDNPLGAEIYVPNEAFVQGLAPAAQNAYDAYAKSLDGIGLDGQKILKQWQDICAEYGGKSTFDEPIDLSEYGVTVEQKS
ncbi:MAG: TRAP transporter substrate-binding protein [Clostridiales Family XIII bacterium]|jgi:TRAP-type C4-dicarboxylate transport system substrate-binding protein|nr:TRAP transporter substrate-binding protein [Clostridiales Family XIII bacterium]